MLVISKRLHPKNIKFFYFGKTYMLYVQLSLCCFEHFHRSNARQHRSAELHIQTGFFYWYAFRVLTLVFDLFFFV